MDTFRKFIASLCAILFILSGMLALFAFNIERTAFTSTAYKEAFEKQGLYDRMPGILAGVLFNATAENPIAQPFLKALTTEDWQQTIVLLLPPQDLKAITDAALDSVFDYLNGKSDSVVIILTPIKSNLAGPAGVDVTRQILNLQPACTAEQLLQIGLGFVSGDIALCNPPPELLDIMMPFVQSQIQFMSNTIPDQIPLSINTTEDPRARLSQIRTLMKITPVFPLLFLFAVTIFGVRSLIDWLKWWGWPFALIGAGSLTLALVGAPILGLIVQYLLQTQAGFLPPILFATLRETVSAVTGQILQPVVIEGAILAIPGLGMVILAMFLGHRKKYLTQ